MPTLRPAAGRIVQVVMLPPAGTVEPLPPITKLALSTVTPEMAAALFPALEMVMALASGWA